MSVRPCPYLVAAVLSAGFVFAAWPVEGEGPGNIEYSAPSAANERFLFASYTGSSHGRVSAFSLFGDGRLECQIIGRDRSVMAQTNYRLERNKVEALAKTIVENHLMEYESAAVTKRVRERYDSPLRRNPDLSSFVLEVDLSTYSDADGERPTHKLIRMHAPEYQVKLFDEIPEIRALAEIELFLNSFNCWGVEQ